MAIKLLAFDLDGTTLVQHSRLPAANRKALLAAAARGVALVPATGRMLGFLPEEVRALPVRYAITSNGGGVYDLSTGQAVVENLISNEKAQAVQAILDEYDIYIEYYAHGGAITRRGMPELASTHYGLPESKWGFIEGKTYTLTDSLPAMLRETGLCPEKINLPFMQPEQRLEIWARIEALGGLRLTSSIPDNIEINSMEGHKGGALLGLAQKLGLRQEELMALGDNGNDVTMLETAGCSVAVGDAAPEALAAARYVTAPHDQDGLALAIERFVLGTADI
ncbi:HAD family hydrolase [Acutalibacter caecimuris]|uniref:HAD family hydrolase n=1 Tax=Acutalibacter caecimuris TaxID=3093657 RepID=UPI002AC8FA12|nr:HAD family hydrolase [Acutalibacter sp. M00118]